jgi:hypothetical protein
MAGWTAAATSAGTTTPIRTPTVATTGGTIKRSKQVTFLSIDYPHAIAISPPEHPGVQFFFFLCMCVFFICRGITYNLKFRHFFISLSRIVRLVCQPG